MHTETIDYSDGKTSLEGYLAYDTAITGKRPAVIISHAWAGQGEFERKKAEALAQLGYVGFALDLYGKGKRGSNPDENAKLMQPFMDNRAMIVQRLNAALQTVQKHLMVDAKHIGAIGFCFGGLCVLDLARSGAANVKGVVSFHGLLAPPAPSPPPEAKKAKSIGAKVLIQHGFDDPWAKSDALLAFAKEMTEAKADWQAHVYGNTMHAFTNPEANAPDMGLRYDKLADHRSWIAMKNFFEEVFG